MNNKNLADKNVINNFHFEQNGLYKGCFSLIFLVAMVFFISPSVMAGEAKYQQNENAMDDNASSWYLNIGAAYTLGGRSTQSLSNEFTQNGITLVQLDQDDSRFGWKVAGGYQVDENLSFELGFVDLGDIDISLTAEISDPILFANSAKRIHPGTADGYTLSAVYRHSVDHNYSLLGRFGVFNWEGKFDIQEIDTGQNFGGETITGSDFYFGLGGEYHLNDEVSFSLEWEHYKMDEEDANMWSFNLVYWF